MSYGLKVVNIKTEAAKISLVKADRKE